MYDQIDDTLPDHDRYWLAGYPFVQLNTTDQTVAQHVQRLWQTFYNMARTSLPTRRQATIRETVTATRSTLNKE